MRIGGASRKVIFWGGSLVSRYVSIFVCSRPVSSVVFCRLCFVCLASFVSVPMMTLSFLLNVMCLIFSSVCGNV